jgi:hypothetical protein
MSNVTFLPKMSDMTIIDYFAAQAMASLVQIKNDRFISEEGAAHISEEAYSLAISMFREKHRAEKCYEEDV